MDIAFLHYYFVQLPTVHYVVTKYKGHQIGNICND